MGLKATSSDKDFLVHDSTGIEPAVKILFSCVRIFRTKIYITKSTVHAGSSPILQNEYVFDYFLLITHDIESSTVQC